MKKEPNGHSMTIENLLCLFCKKNYLPDDGFESSDEDELEDFLSRLESRFGIFVPVFFPAAVLLFSGSVNGFLIDLSTAADSMLVSVTVMSC